ncbi:hemocyte defensin Cg-Defh1-like [Ixodes scapularis]
MAALRFTLFTLLAVSVASAGYFHIEDKPGPPNWGCPESEIACSNHCFSIGVVFSISRHILKTASIAGSSAAAGSNTPLSPHRPVFGTAPRALSPGRGETPAV